jgi:DNA-binding IclR family transcriptional regulator
MTSTVVKAFRLLELSSENHDLDSLAKAANLSKSTAYRLLTTLSRLGYVDHVSRAGYYLGRRLMTLGFQAYNQLHLPSVAHPYLTKLSDLTQETVHLGILDSNHVVYIDKVDGNRGLQMKSRIGSRIIPQNTALGKVLIANLDEENWHTYYDLSLRRTTNSIQNLPNFLSELQRVRSEGYAVDMEENEAGIICIGAPVLDASNHTVAAISLSCVKIYFSKKTIQALIPLVIDYARTISADLGWPG